MSRVRVIDLWTERVVRTLLAYLRSPLFIGDYENGNYVEFTQSGQVIMHGISDLQFETGLTAKPAWRPGLVFWDFEEHCIAVYADDVPDVTQNVGQELFLRVVNKADGNVPVLNGQVLYISGAQGQRPKVNLAIANDYTKACRTIAMVTQAQIDINLVGYTTTFGIVHDVNTLSFNAGDALWLSETTPGGVRNSPPGTGFDRVFIGFVLNSHPVNGTILFAPKLFQTKFGDVVNGNYSEFEADGSLKFNGASTVYDDVYPSSVSVGTGANAPAFDTYNSGNLRAYKFVGTALLKELFIGYQIYHSYKEGTTIVPHIHLFIPNDANGGVIKFSMEYRWVNIGDVNITGTTTVSGTITRAANAGISNNHILSFGDIAGTGKKISSVLMTRLYRDPTDAADTFGGDVFLLSADLHIEKDMVGSRDWLTK